MKLILTLLLVLTFNTATACDASRCFKPTVFPSPKIATQDDDKYPVYVLRSGELRDHKKRMKELDKQKKQLRALCKSGDRYYCAILNQISK